MELRSMNPRERIYAYSQPAPLLDRVGSVGYLRGDFGENGKEFYETWFGPEEENQPKELKSELKAVLKQLRTGNPRLLGSLEEMRRNVRRYQKSKLEGNYCTEYGFRIDGYAYSFMLRCIPVEKDYQFYLFVYQKSFLEDHMKKASNGIQFRGPGYHSSFSLEDGAKLVLSTAGEVKERVCRYINESHVLIGNTIFHHDEFVERCRESGTKYRPKQMQKRT